jgi:hypothetical protein
MVNAVEVIAHSKIVVEDVVEVAARPEIVDVAGAVGIVVRLEIVDVAARRLTGVADEEDVVDMADLRAPEYIESAMVGAVDRAE